MRALGSATISFGLLSIPVKLYSSAESSAAIRFNQINKKDGARVKRQLISAKTGEPVSKEASPLRGSRAREHPPNKQLEAQKLVLLRIE